MVVFMIIIWYGSVHDDHVVWSGERYGSVLDMIIWYGSVHDDHVVW